MSVLALELSQAVRNGNQEWLQDWLEASLWDGRSWVPYSCEQDEDENDAPVVVHQTSLLHKVLEETTTDALPSLLRLFLRHGADPNLLNEVQDAPLHVAARRPEAGDITLPMLLRAGANIHMRNAAGNTVWHEWARCYPKSAIPNNDDVTRLLSRQLNIHHGNHQNWTPLHFASCSNHALANHLIHEYGAHIHASTAQGSTPLHLACRYGSVLCVRHLLTAGAYMYVADNHGRTPFHEAAVGGLLKVTELCQAANRQHAYSLLNWNVACRHGTTALHNAVGHPSALQVILNKGAPVHATDMAGWTAFHYACWIGNLKSAQILYETAPSLLHQRDNKGRTPLHVAVFGLPQTSLFLEIGHDLAPLRNIWWRNANKNVSADERWNQTQGELPPLFNSPSPGWMKLYWQTQRAVVHWLLSRSATVLVADDLGNFPMTYTSDIETLHALVQAAIREGLF